MRRQVERQRIFCTPGRRRLQGRVRYDCSAAYRLRHELCCVHSAPMWKWEAYRYPSTRRGLQGEFLGIISHPTTVSSAFGHLVKLINTEKISMAPALRMTATSKKANDFFWQFFGSHPGTSDDSKGIQGLRKKTRLLSLHKDSQSVRL